jgi:hypothetical protein
MLFNLARARLAQDTHAGAQAILKTHPQHWSRACFRLGSNCDSVDNNLCESFNKWIVEARFLPIITMLETIRRKVMVRIQEQRSKSERWMGRICPNILRKLNAYIKLSGYYHAISNGAEKFEVTHWDHRFTVDLQEKTCSCRYWQLSGLPCYHAISSIYFKTSSLEDYIADCYSVENFKKTYNYCLEPVEGMESWPISDRPKLKSPGYIKMPGRPKTERKREPHEAPQATKMSRVGTIIRCHKCKQVGHNRSSCEKRSASAAASGAAPSTHAPSAPVPSAPAPINPSSTQQSSNSNKRNLSLASSSQKSIETKSTTKKVDCNFRILFCKLINCYH